MGIFGDQDDPLGADLKSLDSMQFASADGLSSCLRDIVFKYIDDKNYCHDRRYLKACLLYAEGSPSPPEMYAIILGKGIGRYFSFLYEQIAGFYEREKK